MSLSRVRDQVRKDDTRRKIELGGLVIKAGIVDLTGDDRAMIYGALLWMADKLQSDQGEHARALWTTRGKHALETERGSTNLAAAQDRPNGA